MYLVWLEVLILACTFAYIHFSHKREVKALLYDKYMYQISHYWPFLISSHVFVVNAYLYSILKPVHEILVLIADA